MAGKHQIFSSNSMTKQKAKRCWRRQAKQRLHAAGHVEAPTPQVEIVLEEQLKDGQIVYETAAQFGTDLGKELQEARTASMQEAIRQFTPLIRKWRDCSQADFESVFKHHHATDLAYAYQRFKLMPLDFFLSLDAHQQYRFIRWLKDGAAV